MESNPYAPPTAFVADSEPDTHGLKHRSVWLVVVFLFITFGLYYLIWFFRRRPGLNRLDSPTKLELWPLVVAAVFFGAQFVLGLVAGTEPLPNVIGQTGNLVMMVLQLVIGIGLVVQSFRVKDIIQDHASPRPDPEQRFADQVKLSGVMTFFFSVIYLQWAINKYVVGNSAR